MEESIADMFVLTSLILRDGKPCTLADLVSDTNLSPNDVCNSLESLTDKDYFHWGEESFFFGGKSYRKVVYWVKDYRDPEQAVKV